MITLIIIIVYNNNTNNNNNIYWYYTINDAHIYIDWMSISYDGINWDIHVIPYHTNHIYIYNYICIYIYTRSIVLLHSYKGHGTFKTNDNLPV